MDRIALLSNVTVDLIAETLKKNAQVYLSPGFDMWQQEVYTQESGLYNFAPNAVVVLLYANAYRDNLKNKELGKELIDTWIAAIKNLAEKMQSVPIIVSDIDVIPGCHYGSDERSELYLEQYMLEALEELNGIGLPIYVLPVKDTVTDMGRKSFYSQKMWYMGSMPYSIRGIAKLSELIQRFVSAANGRKKKCIAVDLDNTLWGGVIGEDGVDGIILSNNKEGSRYKDTQRLLKEMQKQGVMLAVLSKNNQEDIEEVFSHPDMILKHDDFVSEIVNWNSKAENIQELAKYLNIGIDSFVFLDDNPAEREQMKNLCPEVTVIDFPKDTSLLPNVVRKAYYDYFFSLDISDEDIEKTKMYKSEVKRKEIQKSTTSVNDYLIMLEMSIDVHDMSPTEEKRVVQLVNKTNQFNLTTKRHSQTDIRKMASDNNFEIITAHMSDKYGDQGLVAVVILKYEDKIATIDTFLMSCRVMGRTAEEVIMEAVKIKLEKRQVEFLTAEYVKTAKNEPVKKLYDRLGFKNTANSGNENEVGYRRFYKIPTKDISDTSHVFKSITMFGENL